MIKSQPNYAHDTTVALSCHMQYSWGRTGVGVNGGGGLGFGAGPPTPDPRGSTPYPRPIFPPYSHPFFSLFFSGTPTQNSPRPPPIWPPTPPIFLQKPPYPRPLTPDISRAFCLKMTLFWLLASLFDSNQNWMHRVFSTTCTMVSRMKFIVKNKANLILTHWGRNKNVRHIANGIFNFISLIENQCIFK